MDVTLPDGTVIAGVPDGTTKAQLAAKLQSNGMTVPPEWLAPPAPKAGVNIPKEPTSFTGWLGFLARNLAEGGGQVLDTVGNALTGGLTGAFEPDDQEAANLKAMEQGHPYAAAATRMIGGAAVPIAGEASSLSQVAKGVTKAGALGAITHGADEIDPTGTLGTLAALNPVDPVAILKNRAKSYLTNLEATAPPRVQAATADASAINPDMQTFGQTTNSPVIRKLGEGAAGADTQEASARIADSLSQGLIEQAKAIAPTGVNVPSVANDVKAAISRRDAELTQRADNVYTSGRSAVTKYGSGEFVPTNNVVNAISDLEAQVADPTNLAPPEVSKRLLALRDSLAPPKQTINSYISRESIPAKTAPNGPGTTWGGFFDLRKQINSLYKDVPTDKITPAMDAAFSQLKSAYYDDLNAAPAGKAKDLAQKTNAVYENLQQQRETLGNSVVASILGKDGKNALSDPDAVLDRVTKMKPEAQAYTRDILQTYSPDTLDALRSYAIHKHVQDAMRPASPAFTSSTDVRSLSPKTLADTGLFTPEQAAELNKRQAAVDTALSHLPEEGNGNVGVSPETAGRLIGSKLNPIFLTGAASKFLTAGKLEKLINSPEARKALMDYKGSNVSVNKAVQVWRAAVAAQAAKAAQPAPPSTAPQVPTP